MQKLKSFMYKRAEQNGERGERERRERERERNTDRQSFCEYACIYI